MLVPLLLKYVWWLSERYPMFTLEPHWHVQTYFTSCLHSFIRLLSIFLGWPSSGNILNIFTMIKGVNVLYQADFFIRHFFFVSLNLCLPINNLKTKMAALLDKNVIGCLKFTITVILWFFSPTPPPFYIQIILNYLKYIHVLS